MNKFFQAAAVALMLMPVAGLAQDPNAAMRAYKEGDYKTAMQEWRLLAEQGDARAQFSVGGLYMFGLGVTQDHAEAIKWTRMAAEQGYLMAQINLGILHTSGLGVAQDHAEAVKWTRMAAEQGDSMAQSNLGYAYAEGVGV